MKGAVEALRRELAGLRAGRATPALVDRVTVEYYGTPTPLRELATLSVPEPRQLLIQPWDRSIVGAIERALLKSDLGVQPVSDGQVIRIHLPPLTEERRRELVKSIRRMEEEQKVAVRNCRRDALEAIREAARRGDITEDEARREQEELQRTTDRYVAEIEGLVREKEREILQV
ncbi:MAG: ribosome recycling factor [Firmicutes bacterium]|nr:ribosome recycling factor [Bacillota bacterium]